MAAVELQQAVSVLPKAAAIASSSKSCSQGLLSLRRQRVPRSRACIRAAIAHEEEKKMQVSRRQLLLAGPQLALAFGALQLQTAAGAESAGTSKVFSEWEQVVLPVDPEVELLDVAFVQGDWDHGFLVGTKQTLLETTDGGRSWSRCSVPDGVEAASAEHSFTKISFSDRQGWIIGSPAIVLHTNDGGSNWRRVPLSFKLSKTPLTIKAFGQDRAEIVTDEGAVYVTSDGGTSWKSIALQGASGNAKLPSSVELSKAERSFYGEYVAVSSQGNSFLIWDPEVARWQTHGDWRSSSIYNVGWRSDGSLWLVNQDGGLYMTNGPEELDSFRESSFSIQGLGIRDIGFRTQYEAWAVGSGGLVLRTLDGGNTWIRDRLQDNFSANLSGLRFIDGRGFLMGEGGLLFRHLIYKRRFEYMDIQVLRDMIRESEERKEYDYFDFENGF